jgi:hypothetical protein
MNDNNLIFTTRQAAIQQGINDPVPYIVDHGPGGETKTSAGFGKPRPYYTLWWLALTRDQDPDNYQKSGLSRDATQLSFIKIPSQVKLKVNQTSVGTPQFRVTAPAFNKTQLFVPSTITPGGLHTNTPYVTATPYRSPTP